MTAASSALAPAPAGWVVRRDLCAPGSAADPGEVRIWGLAPEERLLRSLRRVGCRDLRVVDAQAPPSERGAVLALRADVVLDERLLEGLRHAPDTLLVTSELGLVGAHVASERASAACAALARADADALPGARRVTPPELADAYVAALRKREP